MNPAPASPAPAPALPALSPLRVAAVQSESVAGDVAANVATATAAVVAAAGRGADLVVLPELFLCGYDPETWRARPAECDVTTVDPRLEPLRRAACDHGVALLVGASVRMSNGARALALLSFTGSGEVSVAYAKQHLWRDERAVFAPGTEGASVHLNGWPIGLGICYDGCFPEHARAAADAGALVYVCPSAYVVGSEHRRDVYYRARALDNNIFVVMAGLTGRCGSLDFSGGSAIFDPQGRALARGESGISLVVADLEISAIREARTVNPYHEDRPFSLGNRRMVALDRTG